MPSPSNAGEEVDGYESFARLYPALRRFAAVIADLDLEPDDLLQEALAATLERQDFGEIRDPGPYLKRAMVNAVASHRRRGGILRRITPRLAGEASRVDSYPSDLGVLDELAPIDRAVVFLIDVEGMSSGEAAEQLGLTEGATRKRVSRARRKLRTILGSHLSVVPDPPLPETPVPNTPETPR